MAERTDHVIQVDAVDEGIARLSKSSFAAQELFVEMAAVWSINSANPQDNRRKFAPGKCIKKLSLGFDQNTAGDALWRRGTLFRNQRAIILAVDAGAAGVKVFRGGALLEPANDVPRPFEVNLAVLL